jgi:hypothetical protein
MPARDKSRLGEPCWVDLMTNDTARAREFYTSLFGWTTTEATDEFGNYITFWHDEERVAGLAGQMQGSQPPNAWMTYLSVADADDTTKRARAAGGRVIAEPTTVGDQGRMAILADPTGAPFGLWQSDQHTGYGRFGEVGTPVWHELNTRDFPAAVTFYQSLFGWRLTSLGDTDEFRYSIFGPEGQEVGGIYDAKATSPEGEAARWSIYFGVTDVGDAASNVPRLGGTILREPWDSEFGTFSEVSDPTGAVFLLGSVENAESASTDAPTMEGHA